MPFISHCSPNVGTLLRIAGTRGLSMVVASRTRTSEDDSRGESYFVDEFETVSFRPDTDGGPKIGTKVVERYISECSISGIGVGGNLAGLQVIGKAKVSKPGVVTYKFH